MPEIHTSAITGGTTPGNHALGRGWSEFSTVYEQGTKLVGRAFVCYQVRREGQGRKFGVTVSRKVGKAVTRNRVKRYLREIYRTHRPHLAQDVYLVMVARPSSARMTFNQCRDAVRRRS